MRGNQAGSLRRSVGAGLDLETRAAMTFRPAGVLEYTPAPGIEQQEAEAIARGRGAMLTRHADADRQVTVMPEGGVPEAIRVESAVIQADGSVDVVVKQGVTDAAATKAARAIAKFHGGAKGGEIRIRRVDA